VAYNALIIIKLNLGILRFYSISNVTVHVWMMYWMFETVDDHVDSVK